MTIGGRRDVNRETVEDDSSRPSMRRLDDEMAPSESVTRWLTAWRAGERGAEARLIEHVYDELRRIARAHLARERNDHTLEPTALAHEAYLRLIRQDQVEWRDRVHFFAIASRMMRRILVDHARRARNLKRGGDQIRVPLTDFPLTDDDRPHVMLEVDRLLNRLAERDPTKASIVEMRFFGGMTEKETAAVLGCSPRTVTRHWRTARAWLLESLSG